MFGSDVSLVSVLGLISLVVGILVGIGGLSYPSVSRKSMRATIEVLIIQKEVLEEALADKTSEAARLAAQVEVLASMRDRQVAAGIVKQLIEEGALASDRRRRPRLEADGLPHADD